MTPFSRFIDISRPYTENMTVFPGDPPPVFTTCTENGIACTTVRLSLHTGTHVDAPRHVFPGADGAMPGFISGPACVVAVDAPIIEASHVEAWPLRRRDRVLVRSTSAQCRLTPMAAQELVRRGVLLLGIGFLSPDATDDDALPVHRILLENGVILLENLALDDVPPGRCHLFAGWPGFPGCEASWVKAVLAW